MLNGWWPGRGVYRVSIAAFALFVLLLTLVELDHLAPLLPDLSITTALHDWARASEARYAFWTAVSDAGRSMLLLPVYGLIVILCLVRRQPDAALFVALAGGVYPAMSSVAKMIVARPRPLIADPTQTFQQTSFPSGHSGNAMTLAVVLVAIFARSVSRAARWLFCMVALAIPLLIGTSRMALGVHFPSDVLAGFCLAVSWSALVAYLIRVLATHVRALRGAPQQPAS